MGNRLSMSRLWLAHLCAYFARPDVHYTETPPGRPARVGLITHSLQEIRVTGRNVTLDDVDLHELAEAKALIDGPFGAWLDATKWTECEIGFRYDAESDTTSVGPRRGDPGYDDHGPMVLKGTLDLIKVDEQGIDVVDTKTGKVDNAHAEQLYGQAVAASRFYRRDTARVGFVFPRKTKVITPEWETLDGDRLDAEAGRIRRVLRSIPNAKPRPGDHCFRCPARAACPEQRRDEYIPPEPPALLNEDARLF